MKIISNRYINILDDESAKLVQSIQNPTVLDNTVYDVIENYSDTFGNFLFQNKIKGTDFPFESNTSSEFYERLKQQVSINNLNDSGIYNINYYFVNDIFDSIQNNKNRFIVTEISSDRREVRLNPLSSEESFIDRFNKFKDYKKQRLVFGDVSDPNTILQEYINNSVNGYVDNFFVENNINILISNLTIFYRGNSIQLRSYLGIYYSPDVLDNVINSIKKSILDTKPSVLRGIIIDTIPNDRILTEYKQNFTQNNTEENLQKIEKRVFDLIESKLVNLIIDNIDLELNEDFIEIPTSGGGGGGGNGGGSETIFGCTDPTALNYNPLATSNDGTCLFKTNVTQYPPFGYAGEYDGQINIDGEQGKKYVWNEESQRWIEELGPQRGGGGNGGSQDGCELYNQYVLTNTEPPFGVSNVTCNGQTWTWSPSAGRWVRVPIQQL